MRVRNKAIVRWQHGVTHSFSKLGSVNVKVVQELANGDLSAAILVHLVEKVKQSLCLVVGEAQSFDGLGVPLQDATTTRVW